MADCKCEPHENFSTTIDLSLIICSTTYHIPGLYSNNGSEFIFHYQEDSIKLNLSLPCSKIPLYAELKEIPQYAFGLQYSGSIKIVHENGEEFSILIPECYSYNPTASSNPFLTYAQHLFIIKLIGIEVRAAVLGVTEENLDAIQKLFKVNSKLYNSVRYICEWLHLQIKCACYRKFLPLQFYQMIISKAALGKFRLEDKDHCKEYLESCLRDADVVLPLAYYESIAKDEKCLNSEAKIEMLKVCSSLTRKKKGFILKELPKTVSQLLHVRQGRRLSQLINEIDIYYCNYMSVEHLSKCIVF